VASGGVGRRGGGPGLRWRGVARRGAVRAARPAARRGAGVAAEFSLVGAGSMGGERSGGSKV
jgi:hypothetical protein